MFMVKAAKLITNEVIVLTVILINASVMVALDTQPSLDKTIGSWILWVDFACVLYFAFELFVKLSDLGVKKYFSDNWNRLDCAIVVLSLPVLIEPFLSGGIGWLEDVAILRLARFLRLWRILRYVYTSDTYKCLRVPVLLLIGLSGSLLLAESCKDMLGDNFANIKLTFDVLLILSLTFLIARIIKVFFATFVRRKLTAEPYFFDISLVDFMSLAASLFIGLNGLMLAIQTAGHDPFTILAGLGIGGMAIAFAAQDAVANIIAGIMLLVQKPFRTGDWINIAGKSGAVHHIGLRCTTLEEFGGEHLIFPNKVFMDSPVRNIDKRGFYLLTGDIKLHHETQPEDISYLIDKIKEICANHPELHNECGVRFEGFGEACYPVSFWLCVKEWNKDQAIVYRDHWEKIRVVEQDFYIHAAKAMELKQLRVAMPIREMTSGQIKSA
ncbi:mechanosensitive ion channel protein MscS [Vibrio azureus]|nr:mechanosensitive ion channel protein MscS [Vibrio azureus]